MTRIARASSHIGAAAVFLSLCLSPSAPPAFASGTEAAGDVTVISVGMGPPPGEKTPAGEKPPIVTALDDAERKAVLSFIYDALGKDEFLRLEDALDTLILPEYGKYVRGAEVVSTAPFPDARVVIVTARVVLDARSLGAYLDNIQKLSAAPAEPEPLSPARKDILIKKAEAVFIQAEVATGILNDRIRGIESYLAAENIFEAAEYDDGVYRCLMGLGRARMSLGDAAGAADDIEAADRLAQKLGGPVYEAQVRLSRARLLLLTGDTEGAEGEAARALAEAPASGEPALLGDCLLLCAEIDRINGKTAEGISKIRRAVAVFEGSADIRRLEQAHLALGFLLADTGDFAGAVSALKIAESLAERQDDGVGKVAALIGIGAALSASGDPRAAAPYLRDGLTVAHDLGWVAGETAAHCETARLLINSGDLAGAASEAGLAHMLAFSTDSPTLRAAALFAEGEASLAAGKKEQAFELFAACVKAASDLRASGAGPMISSLAGDRMDAAVGAVLSLSSELGEQGEALSCLLGAEGGYVCRWVTYHPLLFPDREGRLVGSLREAAKSAVATERALLSGDFVRLAETSRAEVVRRHREADEALSEIRSTISARTPALAAFVGIDVPDAGDFRRVLAADAAFVHFFVGEKDAFGIVVTKNGPSVTSLGATKDMITELVNALNDEIASAPVPAPEGAAGVVVVPFAGTADRLYGLLVTPLIGRLSGVTTLGISPGIALGSLSVNALGHLSAEGGFVMLVEEYTVFTASCLSPRLAAVPPVPTPVQTLTIVGDNDLVDDRLSSLFSDVRTVGDGRDAETEGGGARARTVLVLSHAGSWPWWEEDAPLVVRAAGEAPGLGPFLGTEYLAFMKDTTYILLPGGIGPEEASAFLATLIEASGPISFLRGWAGTVRTLAEGVRAGGPVDWIPIMLITDFVSEQR